MASKKNLSGYLSGIHTIGPKSHPQIITDNLVDQNATETVQGVRCQIFISHPYLSIYSVSQKKSPRFSYIFSKRLRIFRQNFPGQPCVPIYARLQIFIQLPATLKKLCYIKRDHPVHTICSKCPENLSGEGG